VECCLCKVVKPKEKFAYRHTQLLRIDKKDRRGALCMKCNRLIFASSLATGDGLHKQVGTVLVDEAR